MLPTSRLGAQEKHHRKCSTPASKLCISTPIASMAARPLHGLHSADQFAEFQRNLRLSIIPTGEAHHDAAEETSAHASYQVSCKSSRASSVVNLGFLTGISSITRPAPVMLMFLSSTPRFGALDIQSSQSICVSFQAMAAVSPSSSCNSASLS
jgi:hypothetical protein